MREIRFQLEQRWPPRHHNPHDNIVVKVDGHKYELESGHGSSDDVSVYREGSEIYVLAVNRGLGYAGLDVYSIEDSEIEHTDHDAPDGKYYAIDSSGDVFLDREDDIEADFGEDGLDIDPKDMVKVLLEHIY